MQKKRLSTLAAAALLLAAAPSAHAFDVGGANGWKFSTDGFVNVFGTYQTTEATPAGTRDGSTLTSDSTSTRNQHFGINVGLLPVGIGFNINSPTVNGVDYAVRLGLYPSINHGGGNNVDNDFREINMTATGSFGQILAGRAINLYQAKNILTDMSLFGVGIVGPLNSAPTVGHIGAGYLYPLFNSQFRYTTPDLGGLKVAASINQPYTLIASQGGPGGTTTDIPMIQTEISYGTAHPGGKIQAWISGSYERTSNKGNGRHPQSLGGAGGVEVGAGPADFLVSGYGGKGLGTFLSILNTVPGTEPLDAVGKERVNYGFLTQATFMATKTLKLGLNYGQTRAEETDRDTADRTSGTMVHLQKQQAVTGMVTYNVTPFVQVIGEYTWAETRWWDGAKQDSNIVALGTFIYW